MNTSITKLLVRRMNYVDGNFTEANHLGKAGLVKPEVLFKTMTHIFSSRNYFSDNPITAMLFSSKRYTMVNSREFEWKVMGAGIRPLVVVEKAETATQPGKGNSFFKLVLDENWYRIGDVITPGTVNKRYQSRVVSNPVKYGSGWLYTLQLTDSNPSTYIPVKFLEPGAKWTKLFSVYGEASDQAGSTQFVAPMTMRANLGRLKKQYGVTGDVVNEVLAVTVVDEDGNQYTNWIRYAEATYWKQWYQELERYLWYGRKYSEQVRDTNGRPVDTSPGIQQQLEDSNIHYYSVFSAKLLEEYMMDIYFSRVQPGSRKSIKVFTGEAGMKVFNDAMEALAAKRNYVVVDGNYQPIEKAKSSYHSNAYSYGYQFVKYKLFNGAEVEVVHNPIYDDTTIHFETEPNSGYPLESYRMTFLDFEGSDSLDNNVVLVRKKGGFKLGYYAGLTTPWGPVNKDIMSHKGDWYEMVVQDEIGVIIKDVTKAGELIMNYA